MTDDVQVERITTADRISSDDTLEEERQIRPSCFADYPGQERAKQNLQTYVQSARMRNQVLDHVILHGPPGLGKTTIGQIIANEMNLPFVATNAATIEKQGDLVGILASLEQRTTIFVDEIHRLPRAVEESLYTAMEEFTLDLVVGEGKSARPLKMPIAEFTLVGATTKISLLSKPLLSRFGIQERLDYYTVAELEQIVHRAADVLNIPCSECGVHAIATRARGTPRIANRLLRRVWDFAVVAEKTSIDAEVAMFAADKLEIDAIGLDNTDRQIIHVIAERYQGGPVGIEALAATLGEDRRTIEEVYEPYLVYKGLIGRSARGRILTTIGQSHLQKQNSISLPAKTC